MKTFIAVFILAVSVVPVFGQHNFRDTRWGMTAEQVRRVEKAAFDSQNAEGLYYDIELFDTRCRLSYLFVDDRLFRAGYATVEYYMNESMYFLTYDKFKNSLIAKYGKPKRETVNIPDEYKDDPATGLTLGKVYYIAQWELRDIDILLSVSGGDAGQHVMVVYTNKELNAVYERKGKDKPTDPF